jgi:hypothetical protein
MFIIDKVIYDNETKKATIMRDGEYLYLAGELGLEGRDPYEPVKVHRPAEEVHKAYKRFVELQRLPVTSDHPSEFLDLTVEDSFNCGEGKNPEIAKKSFYTVLDCVMLLKGDVLKDYENGTKEVSCGWEGDFEPVDKEGLGYEYIQRFKDINHIAVVTAGRCGTTCKIGDKMAVREVKDATYKVKAILSGSDLDTMETWASSEAEAKQKMYARLMGNQTTKELVKREGGENAIKYIITKIKDKKTTDAMFKITVKTIVKAGEIEMPIDKMEFTGEFDGRTEQEAVKEAKDWYASELGTNPNRIKIVRVVKVKDTEANMKSVKDSKVKDAKNREEDKMKIKDKLKSILDELGFEVPAEKEAELGEKIDEMETEIEATDQDTKEMNIESLIKLLVFAGVEEDVAQAKVQEFFSVANEEPETTDEDPEKNEDEDEEKKENEDEEEEKKVNDKAIADAFVKGKEAGRAEAVKRFTDVMPVIKSGDFKLADVMGKTACEIKSLFVKKVLNEDIPVNDASLDRVYQIAIKSKKMDVVEVEDSVSDMVKEIDKISFREVN